MNYVIESVVETVLFFSSLLFTNSSLPFLKAKNTKRNERGASGPTKRYIDCFIVYNAFFDKNVNFKHFSVNRTTPPYSFKNQKVGLQYMFSLTNQSDFDHGILFHISVLPATSALQIVWIKCHLKKLFSFTLFWFLPSHIR